MGRRRVYTDKQKQGAVLMVEAAGYPHTVGALNRAARETGIAKQTLSDWVKRGIKKVDEAGKQELEVLMEETRSELTELFDHEIREIFKAMKTTRGEATYKDLTIAAGIITDKLRLLSGESTASVKQDQTQEITIRYVETEAATA